MAVRSVDAILREGSSARRWAIAYSCSISKKSCSLLAADQRRAQLTHLGNVRKQFANRSNAARSLPATQKQG